jgi:hypothetical protein
MSTRGHAPLKSTPELDRWLARVRRTKPEPLEERPPKRPVDAPQPPLFDELPFLVSRGAVKAALAQAERDRRDRLASDRAEAAATVEVTGRL